MNGKFAKQMVRHALGDLDIKSIVQAYVSGLQQGYDLADDDFFHAETRDGEPDEDWYIDGHRPALRRALKNANRWKLD